RVPATLRQAIADSEAATACGTRMHLRLAVDYSAREAIYHAACRFYKVTELSPESFSNVLAEVLRGGSTEVDLLIRTGGEQRLSDFFLCDVGPLVFLALLALFRQSYAHPWDFVNRTRGKLKIYSFGEGGSGRAASVEDCSVAPDMEPGGNLACVASLGCVVRICVRGEFRATPGPISDACRKGIPASAKECSQLAPADHRGRPQKRGSC